MKTVIVKVFCSLTVILLYSCGSGQGPYEMYTKINEDGSCYREFKRNADSAFVAGDSSSLNPFPVILDSTWKRINVIKVYNVTINEKNLKKDSNLRYNITIQKKYPSVKILSESFRFHNSHWDSIIPRISFAKKFQWFYTYYDYAETYPKINPFNIVPVSNYLSNEEILTLYGSNLNLYKGQIGLEIRDMLNNLEGKANAWLNRSYYEEIFKLCRKYYSELNIPIDSMRFFQAKDSIYSLNKDSMSNDGLANVDKLVNMYFKTTVFSNNDSDKDLDEKFKTEFPSFMEYFGTELNYQLSLPGKIVETNTPIVFGDTLSWKVDANRFFFTDYTLTATSRKPNFWAFGVTGIIVVLGLVGLWIKRK